MSLFKGIDTEDSNSTYIAICELCLPITLHVEATFCRSQSKLCGARVNTAQNPRLFVSHAPRISDIESDKILHSQPDKKQFVASKRIRWYAGCEIRSTRNRTWIYGKVGCAKPYDLPLIYASCAHPIFDEEMRKGEMCVPHGIKGVIRADIQPAKPTEPCDGSLISIPLVGYERRIPK